MKTNEEAIAHYAEVVSVIVNHGRGMPLPVCATPKGGEPDTVWCHDGKATKMKRYHVESLRAAGIPFELVPA